ncbi:MAG TPA: MATE family efflux transporter, partial [Phaeodactylibacter sp.]|nr:MATE family efflux transporter [Phaeodactylibacter sp.]
MNKASMDKAIFRLTLPNIVSNISVPLLSSVDTALMGTLTPLHIGAIGIGSMLFNFLYWNLGFLRMGTTGFTAQAYGKGDNTEMSSILIRALLLSVGLAVFLLVFRFYLGELAFRFMQIEADILPIASTYFYIRMWAAPATLGLYVLMGWYFGLQNAFIPLALTIVSNVVNIVLSYYFVIHLHMAAAGVAWGTVIAQYITFFAGLLFLFKYKDLLNHFQAKALLHLRPFVHFLRVNRDIFIRTLVLTGVFAWLYRYSASRGALFLAVTVIILQFLNWMSYALDGFAYAAESLTGRFYGAGETRLTHRVIRRIFFWAGWMALGISVIYGIGFHWIAGIFTQDAPLLEALKPYRLWIAVFPLIGVASYIWDGVFIGLTASKSMRNSMVLSGIFFFVTLYLSEGIWPAYALWVALMVFLIARGVFQTYIYLNKG